MESDAMIKHIADRTGLKLETVQDLLKSGWSYIEEIKRMPRWQRQL